MSNIKPAYLLAESACKAAAPVPTACIEILRSRAAFTTAFCVMTSSSINSIGKLEICSGCCLNMSNTLPKSPEVTACAKLASLFETTCTGISRITVSDFNILINLLFSCVERSSMIPAGIYSLAKAIPLLRSMALMHS